MIVLDICICIVVFLVGINLKNFYTGFTLSEKRWLTALFLFHFLIAVAFHFYVVANGGDAIKYWLLPKEGTFQDVWFLVVNQRSSSFIYFINFLPANVMQLSLFTGNMVYALIGYFGFIYLFKIFKKIFPDPSVLYSVKFLRVPIFPMILFLPNLHFWSSGIGKDAILFFCILGFIYGLINVKQNFKLIGVCLLLSVLIRPHITLFLLVSFGIGYLFDGGLKSYQKIAILGIFIIGLISIFDYVIQTIQLESLEISAIEEFTSNRAQSLSRERTGSGIDTSSYPIPLKIFTFLYRPLFFDINGALAVLSSIENLILLLFTSSLFISRPFQLIKKSGFLIKGMLIFFLLGTISFSLILGNLGIMLRQKNMIIPLLLILGIWILYHKRIRKLNAA